MITVVGAVDEDSPVHRLACQSHAAVIRTCPKLRLKPSRAPIRQERSSCAFLSFKTQKSALLTWGGRHSLKEACDQIVHLHIIMKYMFSPPSSQQGSTQFVV